jgi:hypothetical protein
LLEIHEEKTGLREIFLLKYLYRRVSVLVVYYAFPFKCLVLVNYIAYRKEIAKRVQTAIFTNSFLLQILNLLEITEILAPNFGKLSKINIEVYLPNFVIKISVNFNEFEILNRKELVKPTEF